MTYEGNKIIAFMPAYNEEKFIGKVIDEIPRCVDKIIVVDDNSKDKTVEVSKKHGAIVVKHNVNKGSGACYKDGFKKSLELGADIIVLIHSDGQHEPAEIPRLIEPVISGEADYILGARTKSMYKKMPTLRLLGNKLISLLWSIAVGKWLEDALTGYHAISRKGLQKLDIDSWSDRYKVETDILLDAALKGLRIKEVGVECIYGEEVSLVNPWKDGGKYILHAFEAMGKMAKKKVKIK